MANFTKESPIKPTYLKYETASSNRRFYVHFCSLFSL